MNSDRSDTSTPGHTSLTVDAVHLVDTERNPAAGRYDSTVLHTFTLTPDRS